MESKNLFFECFVVFCVQKERKLLQVKRLDLDAAKTRLKKARMADARAAVSTETQNTSTRSSMQHRQFFSSGCFFVTLINEQCEWILLSVKSLSSLLFREGKAVRALPSLHLKSHKSWLTHRITQHEVDHFISCDLQTVTWAALGNLDFPFLDFLALTSSFFWHLDCFSLKIHHTKTPHLVIYGVIVSLNGNKFRGAQENKREN